MSKNSNYCSIDINKKESYSGMCSTGILQTKNKFSEDKIDSKVTFSAASNYKPRWEMGQEEPKRKS
jgi:hypothetical protein